MTPKIRLDWGEIDRERNAGIPGNLQFNQNPIGFWSPMYKTHVPEYGFLTVQSVPPVVGPGTRPAIVEVFDVAGTLQVHKIVDIPASFEIPHPMSEIHGGAPVLTSDAKNWRLVLNTREVKQWKAVDPGSVAYPAQSAFVKAQNISNLKHNLKF